MARLSSLIEVCEPIDADATCGVALDRFLDAPGCDLLAVVEAGYPVGVIARGAMLAKTAARPVREIMARALTVDSEMSLDQACALILNHAEPVAGLVVVENACYRGVVAARSLLRKLCEADAGQEQAEKRRFLDLISRELRTPMNGVLAVAELLQRQALSTDSQAFVRTILESCQATLRALSDAVELSRAEAGEMAFVGAPVRLRELMDDVQAAWQERAARDGVTLLVAYDGEPELSANLDAGRVRQVFDKLVEAALSGSGSGAVEVSLQARRGHHGLHLHGRVRDTGAGLSADLRVEGLFNNAAGVAADASGANLGMALCRQIVERLGGSVRADSNVGAGVTVAFEFDAEETVAQATPTFVEKHGSRGAAHVLVVDDNATNRMVAEALCEMFDCTSECAQDGVEALEAARSGRFDVILMDIRMPRMDGVEATRAIRALPGAAGAVPIIALTANADPEDAKTYVACGMHSVVEKPIKPERLLQALNAALPASHGRAVAA